MEYREKLIELILDADDKAYHPWLEQQPLILQPAIMDEFIEIVKELAAEKGIKLDEDGLKGYQEGTQKYEEAILNEQVAAVNLQIAQANADAANQEILDTIDGIKEYVKECVVTNADNADAMKQLAQQIMQLEKDNGDYIAANWEWLNEYL